MSCWRRGLFIRLISYAVLCLLVINPALALQYQSFHTAADFTGKTPDYQPRAYHIQASQQATVLAQLRSQGYEVVAASPADVAYFFGDRFADGERVQQFAANTELRQGEDAACPEGMRPCKGKECEKDDQGRQQLCVAKKKIDCPEGMRPCEGKECKKDERGEQIKCVAVKKVRCPEGMRPCEGKECEEDRQGRRYDCVYADPPASERPAPQPQTSSSVSVRGDFRLPRISGGSGGGRDGAAVFLVIIGVVVIAALFVYAGKWLVDTLSNDEDYYAYWWDLGLSFTSLDTDAGERGNFSGIKLSGGFVPNMHTNFGLELEVGDMDLNLLYNRNRDTEQRIKLRGTYWLLGPTVRWLVGVQDTENMFNSRYIYLNLMGGSSDRKEVDKIASGKIGFNTALGENLRLGIHVGAFYLGLDTDQGFVNDGDNYWYTYGMDLGYRF